MSHAGAQMGSQLTDAYAQLDAANASIRGVLDRVKAEGRQACTADEDRTIQGLFARRDAAKATIAEIDARSLDVRPTPAAAVRAAGQARQTASVSIGREERTYHEGRDREHAAETRTEFKPGAAFLLDVARQALGDPNATERLARHQREVEVETGYQQRTSTTSNFAGLVVPQYLTELYAPAVAKGRPFADICTPHDLPPIGMTVNISQITTPTAAGIQTEGSTVAGQDIDDTLLTENVQTAAGQVTVSRQAIERGVLTEEVTTQDLMRRVAVVLDNQLLNQASTGLSALAAGTTTSFPNTNIDIAHLWPKLFAAQNNIETSLLIQAEPTHFLMHPRRWNWMTSQVSSSWPMFGGSTPPQMTGMVLTNEYGATSRARLANGMIVATDANIITNGGASTNQDEIYCVAADECHLWESPNRETLIRAEQPQAPSLGILFVIYEFFAYSLRRFSGAVQSITGNGLISPTF